MKTKLEKIIISVSGRKLELTLEEARELKRVLNETLEPVVTWHPPIIIERQPTYIPLYAPWEVTCTQDAPKFLC